MEGVNRVAILVRQPADSWEGLRSGLALLAENMWVAIFFIDMEIELLKGKTNQEFQENLEVLDDLEGMAYTNVQANVDKYEYIKCLPLDQLAPKIKEYQLVVPF